VNLEKDIVQRVALMRELGRRLLVYLDAVADTLPTDLVVDTLLMVAESRARTAGLDMEKLAQDFAKVALRKAEEQE
jgi:hypothetical protein